MIVVVLTQGPRVDPIRVRRRDEVADFVMAACDRAQGSLPLDVAVHAIRGAFGLSEGETQADLDALVDDHRLSRGTVGGIPAVWPTLATHVIADRLPAPARRRTHHPVGTGPAGAVSDDRDSRRESASDRPHSATRPRPRVGNGLRATGT